jgi:hypothetical protein
MLFGICLGVDLLIQTIKEIDFANSFGVICLHSFAVHDQFLKFFDDYLIFQFFLTLCTFVHCLRQWTRQGLGLLTALTGGRQG